MTACLAQKHQVPCFQECRGRHMANRAEIWMRQQSMLKPIMNMGFRVKTARFAQLFYHVWHSDHLVGSHNVTGERSDVSNT